MIWFEDESFHQYNPGEMKLQWDPFNLTMNRDAKVQISLWGYKESTIAPQLTHLYTIESNEVNDGLYDLNPADFDDLDLGPEKRAYYMGLIQINLTNPTQEVFMDISP